MNLNPERIRDLLLSPSDPVTDKELVKFLERHLHIEGELEPAEVRLRANALLQTMKEFPELGRGEAVPAPPATPAGSWPPRAWIVFQKLRLASPEPVLAIRQCLTQGLKNGLRPPPEFLPALLDMLEKGELSPRWLSIFDHYDTDRAFGALYLLEAYANPLDALDRPGPGSKIRKQLIHYLAIGGDEKFTGNPERYWPHFKVDEKIVALREVGNDAFVQRYEFYAGECAKSRSPRLREAFLEKCLHAKVAGESRRSAEHLISILRRRKAKPDWTDHWKMNFGKREKELDPLSDQALWLLRRLHPSFYMENVGASAVLEDLSARDCHWLWLSALYEAAIIHRDTDLEPQLRDYWFDRPDRPLLAEFLSSRSVSSFTREIHDQWCAQLLELFPHLEYNEDFLYLIRTSQRSWSKESGVVFLKVVDHYIKEGERITPEIEDILSLAAHLLPSAFADHLRSRRRKLHAGDELAPELDKLIRLLQLRHQFARTLL